MKKFQYFKCVGWIVKESNKKEKTVEFQYFKCVGWIWTDCGQKDYKEFCFNTSNVSVELNLFQIQMEPF